MKMNSMRVPLPVAGPAAALGGAAALPNDIREAATALGVTKGLYVRKVFLPSIAFENPRNS